MKWDMWLAVSLLCVAQTHEAAAFFNGISAALLAFVWHKLDSRMNVIYVCGWCKGSGLDREQPHGHVPVGKWTLCRYCKGTGLPAEGGPSC